MTNKRLAFTLKESARLAETWVQARSGHGRTEIPAKAQIYTARLTLDITPELRQRIKLAAIGGGRTVADMLRQVLEREYPDSAAPQP
jgi:bacterioferritin (cytochrome b1)